MPYYLNSKGTQTEYATIAEVYAHLGAANHPGMQRQVDRAVDQASSLHFRGVYISTDPSWRPSVPGVVPMPAGAIDIPGAGDSHQAVWNYYNEASRTEREILAVEERFDHVISKKAAEARAMFAQVAGDAEAEQILRERYPRVDFDG